MKITKYNLLFILLIIVGLIYSETRNSKRKTYPEYFMKLDVELLGYFYINNRFPTTEEAFSAIHDVDSSLFIDPWGNEIRYKYIGGKNRYYILESDGPPGIRPISSAEWPQVTFDLIEAKMGEGKGAPIRGPGQTQKVPLSRF